MTLSLFLLQLPPEPFCLFYCSCLLFFPCSLLSPIRVSYPFMLAHPLKSGQLRVHIPEGNQFLLPIVAIRTETSQLGVRPEEALL